MMSMMDRFILFAVFDMVEVDELYFTVKKIIWKKHQRVDRMIFESARVIGEKNIPTKSNQGC